MRTTYLAALAAAATSVAAQEPSTSPIANSTDATALENSTSEVVDWPPNQEEGNLGDDYEVSDNTHLAVPEEEEEEEEEDEWITVYETTDCSTTTPELVYPTSLPPDDYYTGKHPVYTTYPTAYHEPCEAGMCAHTYVVTEPCETPGKTWPSTHIPEGFTTTTLHCSACPTPGPVEVTKPCPTPTPAPTYPAGPGGHGGPGGSGGAPEGCPGAPHCPPTAPPAGYSTRPGAGGEAPPAPPAHGNSGEAPPASYPSNGSIPAAPSGSTGPAPGGNGTWPPIENSGAASMFSLGSFVVSVAAFAAFFFQIIGSMWFL